MRRTASLRSVIGATFLTVMAVLATAGTAGAQEDPYGGTTTTTTTQPPGETAPTCDIGLSTTGIGAELVATVRFVPFGATVIIQVGGIEAGRATAPTAEGSGTVTLEVPFTVPELSSGRHLVTAVGADFTLRCGPDPDGLVEVLGSSQGRDGDGAGAATSGGGGGPLAYTGIEVAAFVLVAAVLLLVGRALVAEARRRRQLAPGRTSIRASTTSK